MAVFAHRETSSVLRLESNYRMRRLQKMNDNIRGRESGVTAQLYFPVGAKPPEIVMVANWHQKCCLGKIIFCSDLPQRPVI
jgi:hypothetical protein